MPDERTMRVIFRYGKDGRTRSYGLTPLSDTASELWVESAGSRGVRKRRRLVTFDDDLHVEPFLEEIRKELEAGGWSEL
jgi:uncharacterized protein (DUF58 family)